MQALGCRGFFVSWFCGLSQKGVLWDSFQSNPVLAWHGDCPRLEIVASTHGYHWKHCYRFTKFAYRITDTLLKEHFMKSLPFHIKDRKHLANVIAAERKKGTPDLLIETLRRDGLDYLAQSRSEKARKKQLEHMWNEHIVPLRTERKRVVASLAYKTHNQNNADPRQMALKAYRKVLDTLLSRMEREASGRPFDDRPTVSPIEYAKMKNAPNGGEHWTDFVPTHIKQRVIAMFDEIPYTPKARRKIPFERVIGDELHDIKKERLIRRTEKELVRCKQDVLLNPRDEAMRERVQRIEDALDKIDQLETGEFVPTTWQGLL